MGEASVRMRISVRCVLRMNSQALSLSRITQGKLFADAWYSDDMQEVWMLRYNDMATHRIRRSETYEMR